ncbi:MAG: hypothetical protein NVSMB17_19720 [Candidatus Dormibacteria bacterium]
MTHLRPTRRLPGMLLAAAVIYVFATNSQVVWLYLVSALVLGLAVVGLLAPWYTVRRLRPGLVAHSRRGFVPPLAQDRDRVFVGDLVYLDIRLGDGLAPVEFLGMTRPGGAHVRLEGQERSSAGLVAAVSAEQRGIMRLAGVRIASSWPLGIARAEHEAPLQFEVVVHPRYALPADARRRGTREPTGSSSNRGPGEEFLGLREYHSGDSQRSVHWPTTARTGRLMVVETPRESSNSSAYLLDLGAREGAGAELAVQVAASLAAGNVATGVPVTMAIPGKQRAVQRWPEVLAALADARPLQPGPRQVPAGAVEISASGSNVTMVQGDRVCVVDAAMDLQDALSAWEAD